tara:strand:- start:5690 stop:6559 length:870 start_codon:yes stop_codon:yes gene_type:complete
MLLNSAVHTVNDAFGIIFVVLLIILYIPQFTKFVKRGNSDGFSPWFMFFGHTASLWTMANTFVFYINGWWTCHGAKQCGESFLGFGLVLVQWLLYLLMYGFYIVYLPDKNSVYYNTKPSITRGQLVNRTFAFSFGLGMIGLVTNLVLLGVNNWHNPSESSTLTIWTSFLEVCILVFFLIHYIPQIYETYRLRDAGSISLISLGFMCPGTFAWTIYLAVQGSLVKNNDQTSSPIVWIPYLVVGIMQGILLTLALYFERLKRKHLYLLLNDDLESQSSNNYNTGIEVEWET